MSAAAPLARLDLWRYRVPMRGPAPVAEREGALLAWQPAGRAHPLWSEAAPLPGFSAESLADCLAALRRGLGEPPAWRDGVPVVAPDLPAAARFALESGWLQMGARLGRVPQLRSATLISAQALASGAWPEIRGGAAKVKVGSDPDHEHHQLRRLIGHLPPGARLRLDANRSLDHDGVARLLAGLESQPIDYIEEPLLPGLSYAGWPERSPIPFAWDETLREVPEASLHTPGLGAVVLKPMLTGLAGTHGWVQAAREAGCRVVLSAAYESNLTLDLYARLAEHWSLPGPHGLDTFGPWPCTLLEPLRSQPEHADRPVCDATALKHEERLL